MDKLNKRITAIAKLGKYLCEIDLKEKKYKDLLLTINKTYNHNKWFTIENQLIALKKWGKILNKESLKTWLNKYLINEKNTKKNIGVILAGNIPIVGFHDIICVIITGNTLEVKRSSSDQYLIPFLLEKLCQFDQIFENTFKFIDKKFSKIQMIIATGSNNSSRYFNYYFSHIPSIIRKNRSGIAILDGKESEDEIDLLVADILTYYGLGCRSVSKLFLPINYDLNIIFKSLYKYSKIIKSKKYSNNYDYYKTIFLMNKISFLENGFFILKEDKSYNSPVSCLNYEYYSDLKKLKKKIFDDKDIIQCIATKLNIPNSFPLGSLQSPSLFDYADNIDTIKFILNEN